MKSIFYDVKRCINCKSCEVACEREHDGHQFMWVLQIEERYGIPMNCRHCIAPPCVDACPTGALIRLDSGPVILRPMKCIGCRMCATTCPFGILELDESSNVMLKCDFCLHRLDEGKRPACVTTCPSGCLSYDEFETVMLKNQENAAVSTLRGVSRTPELLPATRVPISLSA